MGMEIKLWRKKYINVFSRFYSKKNHDILILVQQIVK